MEVLLLTEGIAEPEPKGRLANYEAGVWKTEKQWRDEGYKPIEGVPGSWLWTNGYCSTEKKYWHESQITPMYGREIEEYQRKIREKRNSRDRDRYYTRVTAPRLMKRTRERCHAIVDDLGDLPLDPGLQIVLKVETTGVSLTDEPLEVGITDTEGKTLYKSRIRPSWHKWWPEARAVNGICSSDVIGSQSIEQAAADIARIVGSASVVIGYNLEFDLSMLGQFGIWPHDDAKVVYLIEDYARHVGELCEWREGYVYHKMRDAAHDVGVEWRGPSEGSLAGCRAILAIYDYLNKSGG